MSSNRRTLAKPTLAKGKMTLRHPTARKLAVLAIAVLGVSALAACGSNSPPLTLAPKVDLDRYAGRWYVIANIPYFAEKGNVGSYFDISFQAGDKLTDVYTAHPKSFDAATKSYTLKGYVVPGTGNARWRESPFWPLYLSYLILYVDPDYQTALVGYPGRGYGWVFARKPVIDDATYQSLLGRMRDKGYDISQFRRVPQIAAQIGNPGFQ
ncbi:lipocalin family protein [Rhodopila sp.]|uniref:lipocalin family protein n=1 Tax=Rhodopila sp. TaxID=2480087 RepID=UPI003D0E757C